MRRSYNGCVKKNFIITGKIVLLIDENKFFTSKVLMFYLFIYFSLGTDVSL